MTSKSLNIAICLSGESRTWKDVIPSLKKFFSNSNHNYYFFAHTWTTSTYHKEKLDIVIHNPEELRDQMMESLNYTGLIIEDKKCLDFSNNEIYQGLGPSDFSLKMTANTRKPVTFAHMSYSIMKANWLKQQFEFTNNMRFDIVVRSRHDIYYKPGVNFGDIIIEEPGPTSLYCETNCFPNEYWQPHVNDVFYFGNSRIMDVVDGFYRYYGTGIFHSMLNEEWNDCGLKVSGYNVNLYKWLTVKNILIRNINMFFTVVLRKKACNENLLEDFEKLIETDRNLFV